MNQRFKQHLLIIFFAISALLSACKEKGDLMINGRLSNLNIVNASVDELNVYQNGARLNNISTISSGSQTGYVSITANSTSFEVKKAGAADYLIGSFPATLDTNHYYSLFIAGETTNMLFFSNDGITLLDSVKHAIVRFVNASPVTTNVDVTIDTIHFSNVAFKAVTSFRYNLADTAVVKVFQHGTSNLLINAGVPLNLGSANTIYIQGVPGGTGNSALTLKAIVNNQ